MSIQPPPSREKLPVVNGWAEMPRAWIKYFNELANQVTGAAGTAWSNISKSGSSLADLETRNHSALQNLNTADHAHLRLAERDALVGGADITLHFHSADRNLTGSASQTFSVAPATAAAHAVRSDQLSADNTNFPVYEEYRPSAANTSGAFAVSSGYYATRVGKTVTISLLPAVATGTPAAAVSFTYGQALPASMRPASAKFCFIGRVIKTANSQASLVVINTDGTIIVYSDYTLLNNFTTVGDGLASGVGISFSL